jgi:hypothetical protein
MILLPKLERCGQKAKQNVLSLSSSRQWAGTLWPFFPRPYVALSLTPLSFMLMMVIRALRYFQVDLARLTPLFTITGKCQLCFRISLTCGGGKTTPVRSGCRLSRQMLNSWKLHFKEAKYKFVMQANLGAST